MKVRIRRRPEEPELDGVRLDDMTPGSVRIVSPSIGAWLVVQRYAEPEMRHEVRTHEEDFLRQRRDTASVRISCALRRRSYEPRR